MEVKVIDNFLDQSTFENLESVIMGNEISWYYLPHVDYEDEEGERFQFTHAFYKDDQSRSGWFDMMLPLIDKLESKVLVRIKANLLTRTSEHEMHNFHTDIREIQNKHFYTSIFYMNTNNGYTKFAGGATVNSIANRMITFPAEMMHTGTTCTDQKIRVVINFNYLK